MPTPESQEVEREREWEPLTLREIAEAIATGIWSRYNDISEPMDESDFHADADIAEKFLTKYHAHASAEERRRRQAGKLIGMAAGKTTLIVR